MSAPTGDTNPDLDGLGEALAEAMYGLEDISEDWPWAEVPERQRAGFGRRAGALLPIVAAYAEQRARERAVEELRAFYRAAAEDALRLGRQRPNSIADWLLDIGSARADALAADDQTVQR